MRPPFVVGSASSFVAVRNSRPCRGCSASGRDRRHAPAQRPAEPLHTQFALVVAVGAVVVELVVVEQAVVAQQKVVNFLILYTEVEDWVFLVANSL